MGNRGGGVKARLGAALLPAILYLGVGVILVQRLQMRQAAWLGTNLRARHS